MPYMLFCHLLSEQIKLSKSYNGQKIATGFVNGTSTQYQFSLPVVPSGGAGVTTAPVRLRDDSASAEYRGVMAGLNTTNSRTGSIVYTDGGTLGATWGAGSFTAPAANDVVSFSFVYEAA